MGGNVVAPLPQMRGESRLMPCPVCEQPHPLLRLGQIPVLECANAGLKPGEPRLHLDGPAPLLLVGARAVASDKKARRPA